MKQIIIIILVIFTITIFAQVPSCPSHYTDWDELNILLSNLEDEYSDILRVDTLITTNTDNLPVYGVKLSNNVDIKEDKPRLLFVGTCHAEEVMGTEVVLSQIKTICENRNQYPYSYWLQALELWFVPTMNPEGMRIVFGYEEDNPYFESQIGEWYEDGSFRKNRTDVNENNYFDYEPLQVGFDLDGVDLNRNYSFNWVHGDSLYHVGSTSEVYDYYRGAEPLSEAETQAIDQLAEENNFVYSIHWHTSRTGNFSEKCYYSFDWYRNIDTGQSYRPSPDLDIGEELAQNAASRIANQAGDGSYEWHASSGRKGGEHDFMYQKHGTFQLLIECATSNHQPDSLLMEDTIERCMVGQEWLINRALPFHADIENRSILTGHITDANSGEPLEAEIVVSGRSARYLAPRMSDEVGRYWRPLLGGLYDVTIQKEGYESQTIDDLLINQSGWTTQDFALVPLPEINFNCIVQTDGEPIASSIKINGIYEHEYFSENGIFDISFFVGEYEIEVNSDNCYPLIGTILFDGNTFSEIDLSPQDIIYDEDWESGIQDWSVNGEWQLIENLEEGGFCITDSW
ncbi:MAG: M14 family zinc carboxypeptidase, partial [Candidatus Cloacimonadota bacterium]|nr:M14 family zinc carboxypeptidase [Candidatus Cloacimonadota bacterium]